MGRLSRRGFLVRAWAAGLAASMGRVLAGCISARPASIPSTSAPPAHPPGATRTAATPGAPAGPGGAPWSQASTWDGGRVPGPEDVAVVRRPVLLDTDARVAGVVIERGGQLLFDPRASRTLTSTGNVVVQGRLVMRPATAAVTHRLAFAGVDERRFTGGGMDPVEEDTGLWVVGSGQLDLAGTARRAWTRAAGALSAGATSITLAEPPSGWQPGDELVVTPTLPPLRGEGTGQASATAYDTVTVAAVQGYTVRLASPLQADHPATRAAGRTLTAEVLNLTRNVIVEGTPTGRAHVFIRSSRPQSLRSALLRHLGPRRPGGDATELVPGRYALHFHMAGDGSRGSRVEGVVVRDAGSHAFVPHTSHGITFRDCISHNTLEDAYWWDLAPTTRSEAAVTHDTRYERCVASLVRYDPDRQGHRLAGFTLARGDGNACTGCVAVGVQGNTDSSGFHWPEGAEGVWDFTGNVAHNNLRHGIFTWQNTGKVHVITGFTGYHNGGAGISHGAYRNPYRYERSVLHGNAYAAVALHATSEVGGTVPLLLTNLTCDGAGISDYLIVAEKHIEGQAIDQPTRIVRCSFRGARKAAVALLYEGENGPSSIDWLEVRDCAFQGNEFWLADRIMAGSRIEVRGAPYGSLTLRRADQPGTFRPEWNARVQRS